MNIPFDSSSIAWWIVAAIYAVDFIVRLWLLVYIPKNRKPTAATAWLLLIFILPVFGTLFFFIIGSTKLSRTRRRQQRRITKMIKDYTADLRQAGLVSEVPDPYVAQAKLAEALTGLAPTGGNELTITSGYDNIIADMIASIKKAERYVYVEFYTMALDTTTQPFFDALAQAVQRGVTVRVLFDWHGSRKYPRFREMKQYLDTVGVMWHPILKLSLRPSRYNRPDLRNHRKIVVIDTNDAYIGSLNLIDKTYHRKDDISYIELVSHVQGPVVNEAAAVFTIDWYGESGEILRDISNSTPPAQKGSQIVQLIPSGPSYPHPNNLRYFTSLIGNAQKSIVITNPYLVPDESLLAAITSAALRGVKVSILNSEAIDQWMVGHAQRSYYEQLLRAGCTISLYKKPQLVHEKYMVVDDSIAIIGSSNLDIRSFELNLECVVVAYDSKTARTLVKHQKELLKHSTPVLLKQWLKRSGWKSFLDSIARLSSALQ